MWRTNGAQGGSTSSKELNSSNISTNEKERLPPGWVKKESKSQKGRYYYVSPSGKAQWVPPPTKPRVTKSYNWLSEVEIEFGDGRLGVSIREVRQLDNTPYIEFQAEVDDLPKVNGRAGPAEIYNWSVKPHQRLTIGMRVTAIEGLCLAGYAYKEVVDRLRSSSRPVKIKFADVEKGTVENNPQPLEAPPVEKGKDPSIYLQQKREFTRILVTHELHTEMWLVENKKVSRQLKIMQKKWYTVSNEFDILNKQKFLLKKENDQLLLDKSNYENMIKNLKLQESHAMEVPELVQANMLARRQTELNEDISKMGSANSKLRRESTKLKTKLEETEKELAKFELGSSGTDKHMEDDDFFGIDGSAAVSEQLAQIQKKMRQIEEEIQKEQRKSNTVLKEMKQLNKHLSNLHDSNAGMSSVSSSTKTSLSVSPTDSQKSSSTAGKERQRSSVDKTEIAKLEEKILDLRKKKRVISESYTKAARLNNTEVLRDYDKKKRAIKEELKQAQDALHQLKKPSTTVKSTHPDSSKQQSSSKLSTSSLGVESTLAKPGTPQCSKVSLVSSSTTDVMPTTRGYLEKSPTEWVGRGLVGNVKTMRGARERWCEVTYDGFLKYYKRRGDSVVRGEINLADPSFEVVCEDIKRGQEFVVSTNVQQSHFFTKESGDLATWVTTLRGAHNFLVAKKRMELAGIPTPNSDRFNDEDFNNQLPDAVVEDNFPEEDDQFYGRATLGF